MRNRTAHARPRGVHDSEAANGMAGCAECGVNGSARSLVSDLPEEIPVLEGEIELLRIYLADLVSSAFEEER